MTYEKNFPGWEAKTLRGRSVTWEVHDQKAPELRQSYTPGCSELLVGVGYEFEFSQFRIYFAKDAYGIRKPVTDEINFLESVMKVSASDGEIPLLTFTTECSGATKSTGGMEIIVAPIRSQENERFVTHTIDAVLAYMTNQKLGKTSSIVHAIDLARRRNPYILPLTTLIEMRFERRENKAHRAGAQFTVDVPVYKISECLIATYGNMNGKVGVSRTLIHLASQGGARLIAEYGGTRGKKLQETIVTFAWIAALCYIVDIADSIRETTPLNINDYGGKRAFDIVPRFTPGDLVRFCLTGNDRNWLKKQIEKETFLKAFGFLIASLVHDHLSILSRVPNRDSPASLGELRKAIEVNRQNGKESEKIQENILSEFLPGKNSRWKDSEGGHYGNTFGPKASDGERFVGVNNLPTKEIRPIRRRLNLESERGTVCVAFEFRSVQAIEGLEAFWLARFQTYESGAPVVSLPGTSPLWELIQEVRMW